MRTFWFGVLAFVIGFVGGWAATIAVYVIGIELRWWFDRDGGVAMGFGFIIGPVVAIVCGVIAAVWTSAVTARRASERAEGRLAPAHRWPRPVRLIVVSLGYGLAAALVVKLIVWVVSPGPFPAYWMALMVANAPVAAFLVGAAFGGGVVLRGESERPAPVAGASSYPAAYGDLAPSAVPSAPAPIATERVSRYGVRIVTAAFAGFCLGYVTGLAVLAILFHVFGIPLGLHRLSVGVPFGLGALGAAIGAGLAWRTPR